VTEAGRFWWLPFGEVPEISPTDLAERLGLADAPQIVDVRTRAEWKASRIEGALNAPITSLKSELEGLGLDPAKPVVAICLSAHRSIPAVRVLRAAGFEDVCQLQGGMGAWWIAGLPVVKGESDG
jgi:rhodanese-related sulfurtransferase